jgi:hypothetical protein
MSSPVSDEEAQAVMQELLNLPNELLARIVYYVPRLKEFAQANRLTNDVAKVAYEQWRTFFTDVGKRLDDARQKIDGDPTNISAWIHQADAHTTDMQTYDGGELPPDIAVLRQNVQHIITAGLREVIMPYVQADPVAAGAAFDPATADAYNRLMMSYID